VAALFAAWAVGIAAAIHATAGQPRGARILALSFMLPVEGLIALELVVRASRRQLLLTNGTELLIVTRCGPFRMWTKKQLDASFTFPVAVRRIEGRGLRTVKANLLMKGNGASTTLARGLAVVGADKASRLLSAAVTSSTAATSRPDA
jgi:hypothetical protein